MQLLESTHEGIQAKYGKHLKHGSLMIGKMEPNASLTMNKQELK